MKTFTARFFLLFIITAFFSCASDERDPLPSEEGLALDLEKITESYNNSHILNPAEYFEEKVNFKISDKNLVILVGEPGNYKVSFVIQLNDGKRSELEKLDSGIYEIAFLEKDLILNNAQKTLYFAIDSKPLHKDIASNSEIYNVYGIAKWHSDKFKSSSSNAIAYKMAEEAGCTCESVLEPKKLCKSGGPGATSCSQGECSVSCGSGTYACCNDE